MARSMHVVLALGLAVSVAFVAGCTEGNLKMARSYQEKKDYDQAIRHYKLAIEKNPKSRSARYGLVEAIAEQLGQVPQDQLTAEMVEDAMRDVRPAAQPLMDDANVKRYVSVIHQLLAQRYGDRGMDEKAAEAWSEVIKIEPTLAEGHYNLGVALVNMEKRGEAIQRFEKSIELNPYFVKGYFSLGNAFIAEGRYEEAAENFQHALEVDPDDPEVRHNLGVAYSHMKKVEEAVAEFEKVIELHPSFFLAYRSLSTIYKGTKNTEKIAEIDKRWEDYAKAHSEPPGQAEQPGAGGN